MNMESANWDVEQYRHPWDCDEHWEIRKDFLLTYKDRFPEDRLVCLAQVYANIELLGCRYPAEVTKQVNALAQGLNNRSKKRNLITFVKGGNKECPGDEPQQKKNKLAECSSEGIMYASTSPFNGQPSSNSYFDTSVSSNQPHNQANLHSDDNVPSYFTSNYRNQVYSSSENQQASKVKTVIGRKNSSNKTKLPKKQKMPNKPPNSYYLNRQLENTRRIDLPSNQISLLQKHLKIIQQRSPNLNVLSMINQCAAKAHVTLNYIIEVDPFSSFLCTLQVNNISVSQERGSNKKTARIAACTEFINKLLGTCNTDIDKINKNCGSGDHIPTSGVRKIKSHKRQKKNTATNESSEFIIIEKCNESVQPQSILCNSASFNKKMIKFQFETIIGAMLPIRCNVLLDDKIIASANDVSRQKSKVAASFKAVENLKKQCYTVRQKVNISSSGDAISRGSVSHNTKECNTNDTHDALPENNVGNRLLRLMGWAGGGLGKDEDGIKEPVRLQTVIGRNGLGSDVGSANDNKNFRNIITKKLQNYINSSSTSDLVFTSEFSKEERKEIHMIAQRHHLKSVSHGIGNDRYLVISRKWTPQRLLDYVKKAGGSTDKYELIPPS